MKLKSFPSMLAWALVSGVALLGASTMTWAQPQPVRAQAELQYAWTQSQWNFASWAQAQAYAQADVFKRAPLHGVKVDRQGQVFVSTARLVDARVPATLNRLIERAGRVTLEPFPNWGLHALNRPDGLRNVLGFAIDSKNQLWALDMGFAAGDVEAAPGAQKLVIFDIESGRELRRYPLPDAVADRKTSFLNDLALDERRQLAYISDSGSRAENGAAGGIIVLDLQTGLSRRVLDRSPLTGDDPARPLFVNGEPALPGQALRVGINGIALSPDGERLYWSITTGDAVYALDTRHIRGDAQPPADLEAHVIGPVRSGSAEVLMAWPLVRMARSTSPTSR
ncbi:UNVERIFIED_ORG: major royal jelly family protein [Shinella sp. XGS7]|nr:major royal jelly family protein [Shinella sp. XGS7]